MNNGTRAARRVSIEAMEPRRHCDASQLTEVVTSPTVLSVSSASALSVKATVEIDNPGAAIKEKVEVDVYASATPLSASGAVAGNYLLGGKVFGLKLAAGGTTTFKFGLKAKAGAVPDGTYTLFAVVSDAAGAASVASAGPTLTVHAPFIDLSETETFKPLPASVASGGTFAVVDTVRITNGGTDASIGETTIGVYASPDGLVGDGSAIAVPITKIRKIPAGKTITVPVQLKSFPLLTAGTYHLVTQVTDPNGASTTVDTATVAVPGGGTVATSSFTPSVVTARIKDAFDLDTSVVTQTVLLSMSFHNTGSMAITAEPLTISAYRSSSATTLATLIGTTTYSLSVRPRLTIRAIVTPSAELIATHGEGVSTDDEFIVVTVTDSSGAVQTVAYAKEVGVDT